MNDKHHYAVCERVWNGQQYDGNGRVWTGDDLDAANRRCNHLMSRRSSLESLNIIYSVYDQHECDWV